ncbi:hypothetical protein BDV93DRAFT_559010 [Ceratobasidium sp. AG-I]|nr:hypothetical protein BDV93DRAFT_559010 [Ceratobasidium sp. AG-I]
MNFSTLILLALAACPSVLGWGFLTPTNVVANSRVQLQLTNDDGGGYNWPYEFQIWKNVTGKPDEQVNLQYVTTTPFYWDNNQPAGTFIRFYVIDVNKFNAGSQFILISPDPTESVSSVSMVSTASVASVGATATRITSTTTGSQAYPSTPTPTGFYTAISSPLPVKTNVGAIAGGVVGGVLILATLVAGILLFLRRRKPRSISEKVDLDAPIPEIAVTPFEYHPSHSYGGPSQSYGGPSSYAGAGDAPPIYTPPPPSSSSGPSTIMRGLSERKGAYAPVSTVPN